MPISLNYAVSFESNTMSLVYSFVLLFICRLQNKKCFYSHPIYPVKYITYSVKYSKYMYTCPTFIRITHRILIIHISLQQGNTL
jgi:hypothetical protein